MNRWGQAWSRWIVRLLAVGAFGLGCMTLVSANAAFDEAGRWFSRATYLSECTDQSTAQSGCRQLLDDSPHWPAGVAVTDPDVVLAQGSAVHNTGSSILTLGGMLIAIAAVLLSVTPRKIA